MKVNTVSLEQLTVTSQVKKCSALYRTRRFITVFTTARHWYLSSATYIQSTPSYHISLRYILIPSSHVRLGLPNDLFPLGFPTKILYVFLISLMRDISRPPHPPSLDYLNNIL